MRGSWGRLSAIGVLASFAALVGACSQPPPPPPDNGRYVSASSGADSGDCSASASPCATINYAVSQAVAGERIHVSAGTYPEMVVVDKALYFEGPNNIRKAGVNPSARKAEAVVKGFRSPGSPHPSSAYQFNVTVSGFTVDPQGDTSLFTPSTYHLVSLFGGLDVKIRNNIFVGGPYVPTCDYNCTDMVDAAVMVQSGNFEVRDNTFMNFRSPMDVTQFDPTKPITSALITGNVFKQYTNRAIWVQEATWASGGPFPNTVSITGNDFDATGYQDPSGPAGIVMTAGGNSVMNNTFTRNSTGVFLMVCMGDNANAAGDANTFTDNVFTSNGSGIQHYVVSAASCGPNPIAANISGNRFEGDFTLPDLTTRPQVGVYWNGDVGTNGATAPNSLTAECNWWGVASGPVLKGDPGPAGVNTMSLNVDASPWNTAPGGPCDGV